MPSNTINPLLEQSVVSGSRSASSESQKRRRKDYGLFIKSIQILNKGITQLKPQNEPSVAFDVTTETYAKLIKEVLDTLDDAKKGEMSRVLNRALSEDSDSEMAISLPKKRRRGERTSRSVTSTFNI